MAQEYIHPTIRKKLEREGKIVPSQPEVSPEVAEDPGLLRSLGALGLRGGSGFLSTPGGPYGAAVAGGGEYLAELMEGSKPSPTRIGVEAGVGLIPGSWLFKAGKFGQSLLKGGAMSAIGEAGREYASGQELDPKSIGLHMLLGGTVGGGLAKLFPPAKAKETAIDLKDLITKATSGGMSEGVSDLGRGGSFRVAPDAPRLRSRGKPQSVIFDDMGADPRLGPEIPRTAEAGRKVRASTTPLKHPARDLDRAAMEADIIAKENREVNRTIQKAETKLSKAEEAADLQDIRSRMGGTDLGTIRAKGAATQTKAAEEEAARLAGNLNAQDKYRRSVEVARANADAEEAARLAAQGKIDENAAKLAKIEADKAGRVPTEPSVRESISATTPEGARASSSRSFVEEAAEGGAEGAPKVPYSVDKIPDKQTVSTSLYRSLKTAKQHADAHGGTTAGVDIVPAPGGYRVTFSGAEPPPIPKAGAVAKTAEQLRPFNQLTPADQKAITPIITRAVEEGYTGDLEKLGDEVAGRLLAIREGRDILGDTGGGADELLSAIRKLGGISSKKDTTYPGEIKALVEMFSKPGAFKGAQGAARSGSNLFKSGGLSLDNLLTDLKQGGKFAHLNTVDDLIQAIRKAGGTKETVSDIDELAGSLRKGWWKGQADEAIPTSTPPSVASAGAIPARFYKSAREAAGEGYGAVKAAKAAGEQVPEEGRAAAARAAQRISKEAKVKEGGVLNVPPAAAPSNWIEEQLKELEAMSKAKGGPRGGSTVSVLGAGQLRNMLEIAKENPAYTAKVIGGVGGGALGAAVNEDDPLTGAMIGASGGIIAPHVMGQLLRRAASDPNVDARVATELGERAKETVTGTIKALRLLPDAMRGSYLANIPNLPINTFLGPWGGAIMGSLEATVAGEAWGPKALKKLLNPANFLGKMKESFREGSDIIEAAQSRAEGSELAAHAPEWFQNTFGMPGRLMTGGDVAARNILTDAGAPEEVARRITLTSEGQWAFGRGVSGFKRSAHTPGGKKSILAPIALPFHRTIINQFESSLERFPVLGLLYQYKAKDAPDPTSVIKAQQLLGTGAMATAWALGNMIPPTRENQLLANKVLSNFGGQYGLLMAAAFNAGQAARKGGSFGDQGMAMVTEAEMSLPLPTTAAINDAGEFLFRGKVPAVLTPQAFRPETVGKIAGAAGAIAGGLGSLISGQDQPAPTQSQPTGDYVHPTIRRLRQQQQ